MRPTVVQVLGRKDSGKTTLVEQLIAAFRERGLTVAAVKHSHHSVPADDPGSDTWRMAEAGADAVAFVGPDGVLVRHRTPATASGAVRLAAGDADIVVVEGFEVLAEASAIRLSGRPDWRAHLTRNDGGPALECAASDIDALVGAVLGRSSA